MNPPEHPKAWQGGGWNESEDLRVWDPRLRVWLRVPPRSKFYPRLVAVIVGMRRLCQPKRHYTHSPHSERSGLTRRQMETLRLIVHGWLGQRVPTHREIARVQGIRSTNAINGHVRALERKGYLITERYKSRTLMPTERALQLCAEPVPIEAPQRCDTCGREHYLPDRTCAPCRGTVIERTRP